MPCNTAKDVSGHFVLPNRRRINALPDALVGGATQAGGEYASLIAPPSPRIKRASDLQPSGTCQPAATEQVLLLATDVLGMTRISSLWPLPQDIDNEQSALADASRRCVGPCSTLMVVSSNEL